MVRVVHGVTVVVLVADCATFVRVVSITSVVIVLVCHKRVGIKLDAVTVSVDQYVKVRVSGAFDDRVSTMVATVHPSITTTVSVCVGITHES